MKPAINVVPTFHLRRIEPAKIIAEYQAGKFVHLSLPTQKIKVPDVAPIVAPTYGDTLEAPVFAFKDRNNTSVIMASTGHKAFDLFLKTSGDLPKGGICEWCFGEYKDEGIPELLAMRENVFSVLTPTADGRQEIKTLKVYVFWGEIGPAACDFPCRLAKDHATASVPSTHRSPHMLTAEQLTHFLFNLKYPQAGTLKPAPHYRLHERNGGSLSEAEFRSGRYVYYRTTNTLLIPAKVSYLRSP